MDLKKIETDLKNFLYDDSLKATFDGLSNDDSLLELGIIDSIRMLELIEFIENEFKIQVGEDDLVPENFDTISAIVQYIVDRVQG